MDMKVMTKAGLREFIETRIEKQKGAVKEKIKAMIDAKVIPIVDQMLIGYGGLEQRADSMSQEIDKLSTVFHTANSWDIRMIVQKLNSHIVDFRSDFMYQTLNRFYGCELQVHGASFNFKNEALDAALQEIFNETHSLHEKLKQLGQAQSEILTAIGNETTAQKAYKAVAALGIDLRDYEEVAKLPAIIKLSVDPCLINGDCQ